MPRRIIQITNKRLCKCGCDKFLSIYNTSEYCHSCQLRLIDDVIDENNSINKYSDQWNKKRVELNLTGEHMSRKMLKLSTEEAMKNLDEKKNYNKNKDKK